MNVRKFLRHIHSPSLMVVYDLDVVGVPARPAEADSPLVVDSDAVLTAASAFQAFQAVRRWDPQVGQITSIVQHSQLPSCYRLNIRRQALRPLPAPYLLGVAIPKGLDHFTIITRGVI